MKRSYIDALFNSTKDPLLNVRPENPESIIEDLNHKSQITKEESDRESKIEEMIEKIRKKKTGFSDEYIRDYAERRVDQDSDSEENGGGAPPAGPSGP